MKTAIAYTRVSTAQQGKSGPWLRGAIGGPREVRDKGSTNKGTTGMNNEGMKKVGMKK
jgi:hypothetical protein